MGVLAMGLNILKKYCKATPGCPLPVNSHSLSGTRGQSEVLRHRECHPPVWRLRVEASFDLPYRGKQGVPPQDVMLDTRMCLPPPLIFGDFNTLPLISNICEGL